MMTDDDILEIRNKLVSPITALERISRQQPVTPEFINLSLRDIARIVELLKKCDI